MSFSSALNEFLATSSIARAARSQIRNGIVSSETRLDLLRDDQPILPRPSPDLGYRVAKSRGQIQLSQFISTAIFLLSNHLHDVNDGDQGLELLCSLLERDTSLTTTLLRNHVPSIRATWGSLFQFAMNKNRRDIFRVLTDIGIHNHWLKPWLNSSPRRYGHCLVCAIETDCYDTLTNIIAHCCGSSHRQWWWYSGEGILAACRKGNIEFARLLIQQCDVNSSDANSESVGSLKYWSMFQVLIANMESSNDEHALALDLFLANGADVDKKTSREMITQKWEELVGGNKHFDATQPTILDEVFYLKRPLFDKLRPYSRVPVSRVTRTGLLVALEDGSQTLRDYLSARQSVVSSFNPRHVQSLLELILAEQFTMSNSVDMRIVRGLCEFGVDFTMPSVKVDFQNFWRTETDEVVHFDCNTREERAKYLDFTWHQIAGVNERIRLLNTLLAKEGVIGELVLEGWVAQHGTDGLECLAPHLSSFPTKAVRALARAARLNNFQAVEFLLRKGVDPTAFVTVGGLRYSIPAIATQASLFWGEHEMPDAGCSLEMIQFLVRNNTRLVVTPEDSTPFEFVKHLLKYGNLSDLLARIKYVLDTLIEDKASPRIPSYLLEMCFTSSYGRAEDGPSYLLFTRSYGRAEDCQEKKLELFEYLFRQGAEVSPGSPLAALVWGGGGEELVRDVLYSGSDLNEYWVVDSLHEYTPLQGAVWKGDETLVRLFLQEGANINSPARGYYGFTALQAICLWQPAIEEEHQRKIRICHLLINQGADVNAIPAGWMYTVLGFAALLGDLELAALLLREGADINATGREGRTALDEAVYGGRMDMVKFLLKANALSSVRGATGYDGAIDMAEHCGNPAIEDLIREHAGKVDAGIVFNPELLKTQEESCVHGFGRDDDSSDDSNGHALDKHAENAAAAGGTAGPRDKKSGQKEALQTVQGETVIPAGGGANTLDLRLALSREEWPLGPDVEHIQPAEVLDQNES